MDSKNIGLVIQELRKLKKISKVQLAEKLKVTEDTVTLWEEGKEIPDIQTLESITKIFNISYDLLLSGDLEKVRYSIGRVDAVSKTREIFNPKEWYSLDNAAKVYPPQARDGWNMVFRMAAVMKEDVDIDILNNALQDMVDRFPTFMVTLKKGLFWYYFDRVEKAPKVIVGGNHPCLPMPLDGKKYLFRVTVENRRIACDYFHSLTDGTGGTIFLMSLLTRYYELKYGKISDYKDALNVLDNVKNEEIEDSFARYAEKGNYSKRVVKHAYHMKATKVNENIVTHIVMDGTELKNAAKANNCTITVLLTAILMRSMLKKRAYDKSKKPVIIQVPINLRKRLPSKTLRNFAYFMGVETSAKDLSLQEAIEVVKGQIEKGTDKNWLQQVVNSNMRDETNPFIKVVPLFVKNLSLAIVSKILGDEAFSTTFSNVGVINAPDELKSIVDRFEFVLKDDRNGGILMSAITFNNRCTLSFIRSVLESSIEREFVKDLKELGLNIYVESNGGLKNARM